jgi:hypothetical protein
MLAIIADDPILNAKPHASILGFGHALKAFPVQFGEMSPAPALQRRIANLRRVGSCGRRRPAECQDRQAQSKPDGQTRSGSNMDSWPMSGYHSHEPHMLKSAGMPFRFSRNEKHPEGECLRPADLDRPLSRDRIPLSAKVKRRVQTTPWWSFPAFLKSLLRRRSYGKKMMVITDNARYHHTAALEHWQQENGDTFDLLFYLPSLVFGTRSADLERKLN